ncbi:MAG TPA: TonB family protein [Kofleriaceae bacterium]|nr:TonB family protein [Kofleriaceae bacterium]
MAIAIAVGVHAVVLPLIWIELEWADAERQAIVAAAADRAAAPRLALGAVQGVTLANESSLGEPLRIAVGAGNHISFDTTHPLPNAGFDAPGAAAAWRGGGDVGGRPEYGERHHRQTASAQLWDGQRAKRQPREGDDGRARSEEWMVRARERGFADRTAPAERRSRVGDEVGATGVDDGVGARADDTTAPAPRWELADPMFDSGAQRRQAQEDRAGLGTRRELALTAVGERATEGRTRGSTRDDQHVAAASSERDPLPIDVDSPSSGGRTAGVRGAPAPGAASQGWGAGRGATTADAPRGAGNPAAEASRGDPYFRRMYDRVDRVIRFPRERALRLQQGLVVVRLVLRPDGRIATVEMARSSGYDDFDRELVRALRAAGPFGPVPARLLGTQRELTVLTPYDFKNPMIR